MASIAGSASNSSYDPYAFAIPKSAAAFSALARSREAIPTISVDVPRCMAGITLTVAIFATPTTPHRIFFVMKSVLYLVETRKAPAGRGQRNFCIFLIRFREFSGGATSYRESEFDWLIDG